MDSEEDFVLPKRPRVMTIVPERLHSGKFKGNVVSAGLQEESPFRAQKDSGDRVALQGGGGKPNCLCDDTKRNQWKKMSARRTVAGDSRETDPEEENGLGKEELEQLRILRETFDGSSEEESESLATVDSGGDILAAGRVLSKTSVKGSLRQSSILAFMKPSHSKQMPSKYLAVTSTSSNSGCKRIIQHPLARPRHKVPKKSVGLGYDTTAAGVQGARTCPFYKRVPGTSFTVDAFSYGVIPGCTAYFLSHFHYDHYGGLKKGFKQPIYCSCATANLVKTRLHVSSDCVHPLPLSKPLTIRGVTVCLLDANHCPGSVMFLFRLSNGRTYLHTGDIRATPEMELYGLLRDTHIDELFLDTTYMDPFYCFPPQPDVIQFAVDIACKAVMRNQRTLIVCGSYTIGKERIFVAVAQALHCTVGVTKEKMSILQCLEDENMMSVLTEDWQTSGVHVLPMDGLSHAKLKLHLDQFSNYFSSLVAFKPTGWTYSNKTADLHSIKPSVRGNISVYGIPYSEHSSFEELRHFVQFLRPGRIVPTVGVSSAKGRQDMQCIFNRWLSL